MRERRAAATAAAAAAAGCLGICLRDRAGNAARSGTGLGRPVGFSFVHSNQVVNSVRRRPTRGSLRPQLPAAQCPLGVPRTKAARSERSSRGGANWPSSGEMARSAQHGGKVPREAKAGERRADTAGSRATPAPRAREGQDAAAIVGYPGKVCEGGRRGRGRGRSFAGSGRKSGIWFPDAARCTLAMTKGGGIARQSHDDDGRGGGCAGQPV